MRRLIVEDLCIQESPFLDPPVIEALLAHHARVYEVERGLRHPLHYVLIDGTKPVINQGAA